MEGNQELIDDDGCRSRLTGRPAVNSGVTFESSERKSEHPISRKTPREMCVALLRYIDEDVLAADAKWNLFIAACQSYRYDTCVKPFPPMFFTNKHEKDINSLLRAIDTVPSFPLLKTFLEQAEKFKLHEVVIQLLYWVLIQMHEPTLETVPKQDFTDVVGLVNCELIAQRPDYIFKVNYSHSSASHIKWLNYKRNYETLFAFHGSRLENFHSILHYGLQLCFTKTTLFGQGVYLSSELLVSLPYSSTGFGWGKSMLGAELSVIALCEVLDHPSVHCQTKESKDKERAMAQDSIAGEVPHKYYVVSNSEMIRLKYLLVYSRSPPAPLMVDGIRRDSFLGWIKQHKLLTCIVGYMFLLASVGLSNNHQVIRYYKIILNKAGIL